MNKLQLLEYFLDFWFSKPNDTKSLEEVELQQFKYSLNRLFASFFNVTYTEYEIIEALKTIECKITLKGAFVTTDFKNIYPCDDPNVIRIPKVMGEINPYIQENASFIFLHLSNVEDVWMISSNLPDHSSEEKKEYQLKIRSKFILFQAFIMAKISKKPFGSLVEDIGFWYLKIDIVVHETGKKFTINL